MAHVTDVASNSNDLLDKIRIWLLTRGWTTNRWQTWSGGYDLCMMKGTTYINFRSYNNTIPWDGVAYMGCGICMYLSTGYDGGLDTVLQPGGPVYNITGQSIGCACNLGAGPFASHQFFDDEAGNYLLMIERAPGVWRHFCWGDSLDKSGAGVWTGGAYFSGWRNNRQTGDNADGGGVSGNFPPMPNSDGNGALAYVRADVDTYMNAWISLTTSPSMTSQDSSRYTGKCGFSAHVCDWGCDWNLAPKYASRFVGRHFNVQDQRSILMPIPIFVARDQGGCSFLGTVPSLAVSNNVLAIGQDLVVGSEVWRQFNGFFVKVVGS